ncbi:MULTISPECIES: hypothetical protein [unclassified Bradyrhizobium]|uniref:hypothetical protein n=1 Tax=unclassified Bradyrhizobium TaxID=2631580 RepID=UPI0027E0FF6D|nr:hypothetical protein [Bradyrhizobium sp. 190]
MDEKLLALAKPKLLIIDELGYLPTLRTCSSSWSAGGWRHADHVEAQRCRRGTVVATAILD